jgi:hypothetical protein
MAIFNPLIEGLLVLMSLACILAYFVVAPLLCLILDLCARWPRVALNPKLICLKNAIINMARLIREYC